MADAFTLRALMGKPVTPTRLSESVLILIDAQNAYRHGSLTLSGIEPALASCARLLARARALGAPVIHIQHDAGPGTPFDPLSESGAFIDVVAPRPGEAVVVKHFPNAFVGTDLEARLQALGARNLVIAGFMTHNCVNSTARGAYNLGYRFTVPGNATATRALPAIGGGELDAATLQAALLVSLTDVFGVVVADEAEIPD